MRLYRVQWIHPHEGTCYEWYATAKQAEQHGGKDAPEGVEVTMTKIVVPDGKEGLVFWLNSNFNRDNG